MHVLNDNNNNNRFNHTHICTHAEWLSTPEGDNLRHPQAQPLLKAHIEVNVHQLAAGGVQKDVVKVPAQQTVVCVHVCACVCMGACMCVRESA